MSQSELDCNKLNMLLMLHKQPADKEIKPDHMRVHKTE